MNVDNRRIEVNGRLKLAELKLLFSSLFPFLVLEVYQGGEPIDNRFKEKTLAQIGKKKTAAEFEIIPKMSVNELEKLFSECLGIHVAVFRKVGTSLLETRFTSGWTLAHQNEKGIQILNDFNLANESS